MEKTIRISNVSCDNQEKNPKRRQKNKAQF